MFTGLVRELAVIDAVAARGSLTRLTVVAPKTAASLAIGDSLAVNGICLTVTHLAGERVQVEATEETRRVTTLARWHRGERVHLEPSLRVGDSIGGHFVLGHVDGVGRVEALERRGGAAVMTVGLAPALAAQLVPKGSIAVDGVSLTLDQGPFTRTFSVTLVPHTLAVTRFGRMSAGDFVNLELDVLAKAAGGAAAGVRGGVEGTSGHRSGSGTGLTLASLLARGWQARGGRTE